MVQKAAGELAGELVGKAAEGAAEKAAGTASPADLRHDDAGFTAAVSAITDAFGDPTRRRVYLFVRDHRPDDAVTVADVAKAVGVHPNVARHHLDKLTAGGYIEIAAPAVTSTATRRAGRPSKHYVAVPVEHTGASELPPARTDDLVLALLGQALDRLPQADAEAMAEEVGANYGRSLASGLTGRGDGTAAGDGSDVGDGHRSLRSAMQAVAAALTAHGFASRATDSGGTLRSGERLRIVNDHCPFGDVAIDHPVLCAVDRGLVRGMLTALYPDGANLSIDTESSIARGDAECATAL